MPIIPPRRDELLTNGGIQTKRTADYLQNLTGTVNESSESISAVSTIESLQAILFTIDQRLGSGNALTSDETGFTVDSTKLTVDMTEA